MSKICHVAIIGSGLASLAAALAIINMQNEKQSSAVATTTTYQITIYERDKSFSDRKEGYGMTLTYDPNGPLQNLGVLEEVAKRDCPSRCHYLFTSEGVVKGYFGNAFYKEVESNKRGTGQRGNLRIPRSELRSILWKALKAKDVDNNVSISWGKRLLSYVDRAMMDKLHQIGNKQCRKTGNDDYQRPVLLTFDDGSTDEVDLLIGADGVNSVVAKQYLHAALPSKKTNSGSAEVGIDTSPKQIGIFIILGISNHFHPHIDERGFYTLDGFHRLFIMPFEGCRLSSSNTRRTMWQLSFPADSNESIRLSSLSPSEMQQEVLNRCKNWHEPFPDMVKNTPLDTVWGTALLDRDPQTFIQHRQSLEIHGRLPSRVILLGDAAHAMSPFKGQGANNALADGPLLCKWLSKAKLDSAVRGFMTEMSRRSGVKVRASREAAITLHSKDCWESMVKQDKPSKPGSTTAVFHGVESMHVQRFLEELEKRGITASLASKLDDSIRSIIEELNVAESPVPNKTMHEISQLQSEAIHFASIGNMQKLRQLSRESYSIIPSSKDARGRSCLHVAAMSGHIQVCRWLLSEANLSSSPLDLDGKSALDLAMAGNHKETTSLLRNWPLNTIDASTNNKDEAETDSYRVAEKQLRGIRTMQQLRSALQKNRGALDVSRSTITRVLGCKVDSTDDEYDLQCTASLAEDHGAFIFRNFVPRRVDQLALAALALRPLNLDYSSVTDTLDMCSVCNSNNKHTSKSLRKKERRQIEKIKSQLTIAPDASIIVQTNFGAQMQSYAHQASEESGSALKKRKIDPFPLSKLRYLNLGVFNYNWGDRRYDVISGAMVLHPRLVSLAEHATSLSINKGDRSDRHLAIDFNMAICNFYHLQRPSDRLGGHQDNVESNLSLPLVTISLGAPGVFLLGRESREEMPTAILLQSGDCMVLSGKSRGYFHGVPTILEYDDDNDISHESEESALFPELSDEGFLVDKEAAASEEDRGYLPTQVELKFAEAFLSTVRMNMSIRQV